MFGLGQSSFPGGIHPTPHKAETREQPIRRLPLPERLYLPLSQRFGSALEPLVAVGAKVGKGQLLASHKDPRSVPIHAPANGELVAIEQTASGPVMVLATSSDPRWGSNSASRNPFALTGDELIAAIRAAGIVGLGGAAFPTALKVDAARQRKVDLLLINGGECEPYLTCDERLMVEQAPAIVAGARLLAHASGAERVVIAVEDNKPEALAALLDAANGEVEVRQVPSLYPMGSERHLIHAVCGRLVPAGGLSLDIGVLVQNVATAAATWEAARYQRPLIERVVTVSGGAIENPANLLVPIGTRVSTLIEACGGLKGSVARLVAGGPMMGQVINNPHQIVDKGTSAILALTEGEVVPRQQANCVRCGRCVAACPMGLMPLTMAAHLKHQDLDGARAAGLDHCLQCGACAYVCPSHLPLTADFRAGKAAVNARQAELRRQERARLQADMKKARLVREAEAKAAAAASRPARASRRPATKEES